MNRFKIYKTILVFVSVVVSTFVLFTNIGYSAVQQGKDEAVFHFVGNNGGLREDIYTFNDVKLWCQLESNISGRRRYSINRIQLKIDLFYSYEDDPLLPISERYSMIFDSSDFNLAYPMSELVFIPKGELINPIEDDFYWVVISIKKNKTFVTPKKSKIVYETRYGGLTISNGGPSGYYIPIGFLWGGFIGLLTLPPEYYTMPGGFPFGNMFLQATPSSIRFLDAEMPSREIFGAAADGESKVIIEVKAHIKPVVIIPEGEGKLLSDFEPVGSEIWHAIWQVPENSIVDRSFKNIDFEFIIDDHTINNSAFVVFKVPVLLLHGLWGDGDVWNTMVGELIKENFFWLDSPSYSNSASFEEIKETDGIPTRRINNFIEMIQKKGYVANKMDVVCHSMGGILAKKYGSKKNIRRIVTIGTPHKGSPLADLGLMLFNNVPEPVQYAMNYWLKKFTPYNPSFDGGALRCLKRGHIVRGNKVGVPCLTVAGISVSDELPPFMDFIVNFVSPFYPELELPPAAYLLHRFLFGKDASDWVVSRNSQIGGVKSSIIDIDLPTLEIGHRLEPFNPTFIRETIEFLNEPKGGIEEEVFFHEVKIPRISPPLDSQVGKIASKNLKVKITKPKKGTKYRPGEKVHVVVEAKKADAVFILGGWEDWKVDSKPPFNLDFKVPKEALGEFEIIAIGRDEQNNIGRDVVKINIVTKSRIKRIEYRPESPYACYVGESVRLDVYGIFKDGVRRNITSNKHGTSYSSDDPTIAEVSDDGVIEGISPGETIITIKNQASTYLHLYVFEAPGGVTHPDPPDGMTGVSPSTNLDWDDIENSIVYDLYIWKASDSKPYIPTAANLIESYYDPAFDLESHTTYFWQVVAKSYSEQIEGPVWTFVTTGQFQNN